MEVPSEGGSDSSVLFRSDRHFQLWRYALGHRMLWFRAYPYGVETSHLVLQFESVAAIKLAIGYKSISVRLADKEERAEMLELSRMPPRHHTSWTAFALDSGPQVTPGFVLCANANVRSYEVPPESQRWTEGPHETLWHYSTYWNARSESPIERCEDG